MTAATAWAHLPNAQHIDRILAHLKTHPERWDAALGAVRDAARGAALGAAWDAARGAALDAARYAIAALIAYDDCAHILDLSPGAVNIMRSANNPKAVLMYAAVLAMQEDKSE